ncbi:hypothetical protein NQ315_003364 [Exocentrus adspersus]|uniref:Retrotransposon gag domain-containing protein n=1 Tax=Exocentrus adspersus TaxID=1586481 RepID=A0AAV8VA61_9CUCU|nr:hypothetical protein NQ315_003364 [Exocentrus adspersus]
MAATGNKFTEFVPDVESWDIYQERLEQHFTANGVEQDKIKVAVLLSSISSNTYRLLRDLCFPSAPKDKKFNDLGELLRQQFSASVSIWRERRQFYALHQGNGETVKEWYARVRSGAVTCKFGADLTRTLIDKFVCGLKAGKGLDRLCEEPETAPLEDLVALAGKVENVAMTSSVASSGSGNENGNPGINIISSAARPARQQRNEEEVRRSRNRSTRFEMPQSQTR